MKASGRELWVRAVLVVLAWYVGCLVGGLLTGARVEVGMIIAPIGITFGAIITPIANILLVLSGLCGMVYVVASRIPRWGVIAFCLLGAVTTAVTLRTWGVD